MLSRWIRFNIYLLAASFLLTLIGTGCQSSKNSSGKKRGKEAATLRLHLQAGPERSSRTVQAPIYRENPIMVNINREPFLSEADILQASVVQIQGVHAIHIQFNRHGTFVLEMISGSNRGRRVAVFSQFGDARWLGAPLISKRIADGTFVFTPDASLEESERIVRGLNNIAKEINKSSRF